MEKINFVNLPSTNTPMNAENLNQMQDNVENAINGIIESGSNENGSWIKWADGTMIITQEFSRTVSINVQSGVMYYCSLHDIPAYPVSFTKVDSTNVTVYNNNILTANPYCNSKTSGSHLNQCCTRILVYAPEILPDETILFNVIAIGRWK